MMTVSWQKIEWRRWFIAALLVSAVVWGICFLTGVGQQKLLLCACGEEELFDFWMPKMCLEQGYSTAKSADYGIDAATVGFHGQGHQIGDEVEYSDWYPTVGGTNVFVTGRVDKVYPAFALLPFEFVPATRVGGYIWSSLAGGGFLLALVLCAHGKWWPLAFICSMPFIYSIERGNPVWLSAAAVGVFLAWWNSELRVRRIVAAVCLGVAACLKIAPAVLGVFYLVRIVREREGGQSPFARPLRPIWGDIVLSAGTAVILFFAFWPMVREGFSAIPMMIQNAAHHADEFLRAADFGFIQINRMFRIVMGLNVHEVWPGMVVLGLASRIAGSTALIWGAWRRNYLLVVGGFMMLAGNMYYYAALYLLPVFVLQPPGKLLEWLGWFVIVCPLQLIVMGHSTNPALCNLALMGLMALQVVPLGQWGGSRGARALP